MDDLAQYNKARWEALAQANVAYSRPLLNLDEQSARTAVDPYGQLGDVRGQDVLCLASGGGQQSVALTMLGANVTVFDLSETQLQRDQEAAAHYGYHIKTIHGDMRDLSCFENDSFDLVIHPYSINFVPDTKPVFDEVARVLRPGGRYNLGCANPFIVHLSETDWDGAGYALKHPYVDGAELYVDDPYWDVEGVDGVKVKVAGPKEFRHTLSTLINGLADRGFMLLGVWEEPIGDVNAQPGSWEHFLAIAPPWLTFWAIYKPIMVHP